MILEKKCSQELGEFFRKLERDIHEIMTTYWDSELGLFHLNKVSDLITLRKQEYYDILFKYCKIQYDKSRKRTKRLFDNQLKQMSIKSDIQITTLSSLFQADPAITYNLNNKIFVASEHTLNRVDKLVMSNISQSYEEGLGIDEAKDRLTVKYNGLKTWEAARIARTELNSAQNDAAYDMCNELGCEYQQWWTAEDERVRDGRKGTADHRSLHGKIVRIGTRFSNGLLYPGDRQGSIKEWINCRCTLIPYILPLGKMVPPGLTEFTEDDLIDIPNWNTPTVKEVLSGDYSTEITSRSKLDAYYEKEFARIAKIQQRDAEEIFLLRNQLDMGGLTEEGVRSKNLRMKTLINKFKNKGENWQDHLTRDSIMKVNSNLNIPAEHDVKIWNEEQLRANLVRAFEYKIPQSLPVKEFNLKYPHETLKWKEYRRLKYLRDSKDYFIREGINYNELADDEIVFKIKREGWDYGLFEDIEDIRYYRHIYDETKFLAPEKESSWIYKVEKWKKLGIDIESLADIKPISLEEREAWAFDLRIYQSKIPDYKKEIIAQREFEEKVRRYKTRLYKRGVDVDDIQYSSRHIPLKTVLKDENLLVDEQLDEFEDWMYGVDYDEIIDVFEESGLKFKDTSKLKVHRFDDIDRWGSKATTSPYDTCSRYELKAIRRYSGDDHERMNRYYKAGEVTRALDDFHEFNEDINWLVDALDKGTNNENLILYKGGEGPWAAPVGEVSAMNKFQSTTIHPPVTNNFGSYKTVFIAPKESVKGMYIDGVSQHSEELEVLLSPHQVYQTLYQDERMTVVKLLRGW